MLKALLAGLTLTVLSLAGCGDSGTTTAPAPGSTTPSAPAVTPAKPAVEIPGVPKGKAVIAVIPKGTTHEFWKSVEAGALDAAKGQRGIAVTWQGPQKEDDREAQIQLLERMIAAQVAAIVIAPLDDTALVKPIEAAARERIPVIVIDSDVKTDKRKSFIATDNRKGGQMAGQAMAKLLGGKGKVALLRYQVGSASTQEREDGFLEAAKAGGLQIVRDTDYAGPTKETALKSSETMLNALRDSDKLTVDGIFAPNESSARGMLKALQNARLTGKAKFIGFDSAPELVEGLKQGALEGLVLQDPYQMGFLGVKTAVRAIKEAKDIPAQQPLPPVYVTKENLGDENVKKLIGS